MAERGAGTPFPLPPISVHLHSHLGSAQVASTRTRAQYTQPAVRTRDTYLACTSADYATRVQVRLVARGSVHTVARKVCCCMLCVVRQTCIAPDYILVHESVKAEFTKKLLEFIPKNFGA